jgi:LmbE family N-acetylglucosaminyl deacetylase
MASDLSILNIGGHPKDAVLYAGGTMAKHAARGDRVCMLTPTTGLSHHLQAIDEYKESQTVPDMAALVEERKQELVAAANELGVSDVRFLGYPDDIVTIDKDIVNDIADVIGEVRPNIIVTHWPYDTVPAHAMATQMTLLAIDAASGIRPGKSYAPTGGDTGGEAAQVFYHVQLGRTNVLETLNMRIPTTIVDITDTVHKKANAMNKFTSQHYGEGLPLQRKLGETLDGGIYAIHHRVPYAEAFIAHNPQVYEYLPLSDYGRQIAAKSGEETLQHFTQMLLTE